MSASAENDYLERILLSRVYDIAQETPLEKAASLSERTGNTVLLKREDMQPVFSFKLRGAYNKMVRLSAQERARGVVAASAGNHAQGVALSAQRLGCEASIVMPVTTPPIKIDAVKRLGATVMLHGESYSDAYKHAMAHVERCGATYIPPFDDPDVIAGQGTIGMEILRAHPGPVHAVFVPIGGGGLAAGVAAYIKRLRPEIRVIGVQAKGSEAMKRSIETGSLVELKAVSLFADGVAVKLVGTETFRLCRLFLDEIIVVDTDAICAAVKSVFEDTRVIAEPAGALAVAGLRSYVEKNALRGETCVAVLSGANMNFDRLRHVAQRAEIGEQREALLAVTIPEQAGSFRRFVTVLEDRSITELTSRFADPVNAQVLVGVKIQGRDEIPHILQKLADNGFPAMDLTDNEFAKTHLRYLVGGHAPAVCSERLVRFTFPERPGAILDFFDAMRMDWSFSLFHYHYHGADYGRVLAGIQVPEKDNAAFQNFLETSGYPYVEESQNPAYKLFLGRQINT